ncbi:polyamine transporter 2 [Penicillium angulare]|uniref:Polyamine transporter 2 n=1 Tax=Penicillium angulare TaxID=116970 RepID=A0A9W9G930_9EURO|nr:polyamine transporter 2 [Penicillium angulare]
MEKAEDTTTSQNSREEENISVEDVQDVDAQWDRHPKNALNLPLGKKFILMAMVSSTAFLTTAASSVVSLAQLPIERDFDVTETASLLPLSLYLFAIAFGPVVGGPLSETVGRMPVYYFGFPLGALFTLGAGLTKNFGALCFLRFVAGLCWAPMLTVAAGSIVETFQPATRGLMMAVFIFMPFLGPGFGPIFGAYAVSQHGWRWTQWVLLFISVFCAILIALTPETFPPIVKRRIALKGESDSAPPPPVTQRIRQFVVIGLVRPVHMFFTEPIISFICLYVAVNFGVLFSFFAAVPYMVETVYGFNTEQSGLVFLSIVVGSFLGLITIFACDILLYRPKAPRYPPGKILPEHRLYSAMIGSFGLPIGLFWFAWTAKSSVSWASPVVAIVPYAWGNLCVFVATAQYVADTYHGSVVASASSSMTLARYGFAGAFPLFISKMYTSMGLDWAISLFGFVTLFLLPIPLVLFKYGPQIRAKSRYPTIEY